MSVALRSSCLRETSFDRGAPTGGKFGEFELFVISISPDSPGRAAPGQYRKRVGLSNDAKYDGDQVFRKICAPERPWQPSGAPLFGISIPKEAVGTCAVRARQAHTLWRSRLHTSGDHHQGSTVTTVRVP